MVGTTTTPYSMFAAWQRRLLQGLLLIVLLAASWACRRDQGSGLIIGTVFPMSGPTADWGQSAFRGAELAAEEVGSGGVKVRLLPAEDNRGDATETGAAIRRLVSLHGAQAILGPITSTNAGAGAAVAAELKVPLVSPSATALALTRTNAFAFRACYTDAYQGRVLADFAQRTLSAKTATVLFDPRDAYSAGLSKVFMGRFKAGGGQVNEVSFSVKDREFGPQIAAVQAGARPEVLFVAGKYPEVAALLRQARRAGLETPVLAGDAVDSPEFFELAGEAAQGTYVTSHFSADGGAPEVKAFVGAYRKRHGQTPNVAAALSHDAVLLLTRAFASKGKDQDLRSALGRTKGVRGTTGAISLDENRDPVKSVVVLRANQGKFEYVRRIEP